MHLRGYDAFDVQGRRVEVKCRDGSVIRRTTTVSFDKLRRSGGMDPIPVQSRLEEGQRGRRHAYIQRL